MAIAHVQSRGAAGTSLAFLSDVTAGNLLVCCIGSAGNITAVSGSTNGAFTKAVDGDIAASLLYGEIWYKENCTGGAETISFTGGFGGHESLGIGEYSGIATSTSLDKTAVATDNSGITNPDSGSTATTTVADELLIGVIANESSRTITPGDSFTERVDAATTTRTCWFGDKIVSATGTYKVSGTLSAGAMWVAAIATFKGAGGGGGGTAVPVFRRHYQLMQMR